MGPSEFSVYVPFYTAAMTKTPDAYTTETTDGFDPDSVYWLFNEIGNAGNGRYYRKDASGIYSDRYGNETDPETAEAVLLALSDSAFVENLHSSMIRAQEEMNAKAAADDALILALAGAGSVDEVSAMADRLARENAEFIRSFASATLTEIDETVNRIVLMPGN